MSQHSFTKIGVIGAGSMGSNMAMLFAENDMDVSVFDTKPENIDNLTTVFRDGLDAKYHTRIASFKEYRLFMECLGGASVPKLLVLSIPHGSPADEVLKDARPWLTRGDVILDGGNEWYENAQRRQKTLQPQGISYLSMGVSGGYQSARRGPSISPSGDKAALDAIMPLLERFAAKDPKTGLPCVVNMGPAGCGHYVKMVHNGIEQGILGIVSEAWELMYKCLHIKLDDIAIAFNKWGSEGELVSGCFLLCALDARRIVPVHSVIVYVVRRHPDLNISNIPRKGLSWVAQCLSLFLMHIAGKQRKLGVSHSRLTGT